VSENQADNIQTEQEAEEKSRTGLPPGLHYDDNARPIEETRQLGSGGTGGTGSLLTVAPIGGQLISSVGGMVGFCPIGGNPGVIGLPNTTVEFSGSAPPTPTQTNYFDCARWQPDLTPAIDDVTQTLAWAQAIALTLPQGRFRVEVINDKRLTPAMLAKYGLINPTLTGNVSLNLGCRMTLLHGNAANYPVVSVIDGGAQVVPDFYYCPCAKLLNPNTVIDAMGKKMVRSLPMELICSAPVFHMPYEAPLLTAYLAHLTAIYQGF